MSYYPGPDIHIRDKVKVVLDLSNYSTNKELEYATGVNISDLTAKKYFVALNAEVDKLDINKLVDVPTSLNNLKTKVDNTDICKFKTVSVDVKRLSDVVDNEVLFMKLFNKLNTKVNKSDKTISDGNQCNTDKENLEKNIGDTDEKVPDVSGLVTKTVLDTKLKKWITKYLTLVV